MLAAALTLLAAPALVEARTLRDGCFETLREVNEKLWVEHGQVVHAHGYTGATATRLYLNENEDTWTIVQTFPQGVTCIQASGTNWATAPFESELVG